MPPSDKPSIGAPRTEADLISLASRVQANAYAKYSDYPVGAALEDNRGRVFLGVNVENISFGGTLCAERSALAAMITAGSRQWHRVAVVTRDGNTPCGICRQLLAEFAAPDAIVLCTNGEGKSQTYRFWDLLPHAFDAEL